MTVIGHTPSERVAAYLAAHRGFPLTEAPNEIASLPTPVVAALVLGDDADYRQERS
jgi:hypothetical protein